ncbi:MAG TPA: DUF2721 domain-containing protein [Verrucomicrobiae bacterium]|jgi:hypothetical protein|nr:DUF2721 domain-containing protein [Verrucomicrobiae bacterium]
MPSPLADNPFAVLTLIAAPAVFTNASSVLALGTGNRLARTMDRTRALAQMLHAKPPDEEAAKVWGQQIDRLQVRARLLVRAMSFFYGAVGCFAAASLVALLGASLAASEYRLPFAVTAGISFLAGAAGFVGQVAGCFLLVRETRLALITLSEEARLARSELKLK